MDIQDILWGIGVNSYNRLHVFFDNMWELSDKQYWEGLSCAYLSSDDLYSARHMVKLLFSDKRPGREYLMTPDDLKVYKSLPEKVTIYRGMTQAEARKKEYGISWTLTKERAEFFAYTYIRNHRTRKWKKTVVEMQVDRDRIIAYFNERKEQEVIVYNAVY